MLEMFQEYLMSPIHSYVEERLQQANERSTCGTINQKVIVSPIILLLEDSQRQDLEALSLVSFSFSREELWLVVCLEIGILGALTKDLSRDSPQSPCFQPCALLLISAEHGGPMSRVFPVQLIWTVSLCSLGELMGAGGRVPDRW